MKQPIELTITRFPGLFSPKELALNLTILDENPTRKTPSRPVPAYLHVFITLLGSPSPTLVVLLNFTKL